MSSEERPLSRWARRKTESRKARGGAAPVVEEDAQPALPAEAPAATHIEAADPAPPPDLPDIESLTAESDFTAFLKEGVPRQLRRLALRKLWTSDPVLANLDGLVDYGEDYTDAAMVVEGMKSAWEVGRGYAKAEPAVDGESAEEGGADEASPEVGNPQVASGEPGETGEDADTPPDEERETRDG